MNVSLYTNGGGFRKKSGLMKEIDYLNKDIFSSTVMDMSRTLYRIAYSILKNNADCEDAVSETIVNAYSKIRQLRDSSLFKPWLIRILKNECFMLLRKRKRVVPVERLPEDITASSHELNIDLYNALNSLKEDARLTITLFYLERYSIDEISYITQVPAGTVKSRLSRARDSLKDKLEKGGDGR